MNNRYVKAFLSSALSITPMIVIVLLLHVFRIAQLNSSELTLLLIGGVVLIVGLALFQIGANTGLTKVGKYMGSSLSKQKNLFIVIIFSLALGALITCAEPSIMIVSKQVQMPAPLMISFIAVGVGIFVVIGVLRIVFHKSLKLWYLLFYAMTFMLLLLISIDEEKRQFLPFIFDSGGATTGSATVPFILALGAGVATVRGGKHAKNDSFGLVGLASIGPILTMTILILFNSKGGDIGTYNLISGDENIFMSFINAMLPGNGTMGSMLEVAIALSPIIIIFLIYELIFIRLPWNKILKVFFGFLFCFVGLSLFLSATSAVMSPIGNRVGQALGEFGVNNGYWVIILVSFVIGLVTILCEPAVHVLTTQMQNISDGHIRKITVLITLSIGVGIAIALSSIRSLYDFSILYYIVPGYMLSLILMFFCPTIYVAMAFDSGGTASGPMSSSFVLPMIVGVTLTPGIANVDSSAFEQAFGVVALIALTPIIAIQLLGVNQNIQSARARRIMRKAVYVADDAQIIHF